MYKAGIYKQRYKYKSLATMAYLIGSVLKGFDRRQEILPLSYPADIQIMGGLAFVCNIA